MLYKLMLFFDAIAKESLDLPIETFVIRHLQIDSKSGLLVLRDGCERLIHLINLELQ